MPELKRKSRFSGGDGVRIETYVEGDGPTFVILPSCGRDGGEDFDDLAARMKGAAWRVLRPQPRGIAGSIGPMTGLTLDDLAEDVALSIRSFGTGSAVVLGHAFGNFVARALTTNHPDLVSAAVLAAADTSKVPGNIERTPFIAADVSAPEDERLAALRLAFFAPGNDPRIWLSGWHPETLQMQHAALEASTLSRYWACGDVPLLQLFGESDPFTPKSSWNDMRSRFGNRVETVTIASASHALFPEQPNAVWEAVRGWLAD